MSEQFIADLNLGNEMVPCELEVRMADGSRSIVRETVRCGVRLGKTHADLVLLVVSGA